MNYEHNSSFLLYNLFTLWTVVNHLTLCLSIVSWIMTHLKNLALFSLSTSAFGFLLCFRSRNYRRKKRDLEWMTLRKPSENRFFDKKWKQKCFCLRRTSLRRDYHLVIFEFHFYCFRITRRNSFEEKTNWPRRKRVLVREINSRGPSRSYHEWSLAFDCYLLEAASEAEPMQFQEASSDSPRILHNSNLVHHRTFTQKRFLLLLFLSGCVENVKREETRKISSRSQRHNGKKISVISNSTRRRRTANTCS